jgi:hypothetical protein
MKNVFYALGVSTWVMACSLQHPQDLALPTVQLPTNVSDVTATETDGHFIVHVWEVPIVLSTDFDPG